MSGPSKAVRTARPSTSHKAKRSVIAHGRIYFDGEAIVGELLQGEGISPDIPSNGSGFDITIPEHSKNIIVHVMSEQADGFLFSADMSGNTNTIPITAILSSTLAPQDVVATGCLCSVVVCRQS